jgi:hypothetical protein
MKSVKGGIVIPIVEHTAFSRALALMKGCHLASKDYHEPNCLFITGSSGTGKTSLVTHYLKNVRFRTGIIAIETLGDGTFDLLTSSLCEKLGCEIKEDTPLQQKISIISDKLKENNIGSLIIDDFQKLLISNDGKVNSEILLLLEKIRVQANVSIVALGLPISKVFVKQHPELLRLFSFHYELLPFSQEHLKDFKQFLQKIEKHIPCSFSPEIVGHDDVVLKKILLETEGLLSNIIPFINLAINLVLQKGKKRIDLSDLVKTFEHFSDIGKNPFVTNPS